MSGDTILRQWAMMQCVPRYPSRRSTSEITRALMSKGFKVTVRTVQRDLDKLSLLFGLSCDRDVRTNYWFFPKEQRVFDLPGMDTGAALALLLAEQQALAMLPPSSFAKLRPQLDRAREVIKEAVPTRLAKWSDRFKMIHRGPLLRPAPITESIQEAAYEAVLTGHQLRVRYQARPDSAQKEQVLHPYVVVLREGVVYLVASAWDYEDLRQYALHRISFAEVLSEKVRSMPIDNVDDYVNRHFRYPVGDQPIALKLRIEAGAARHLIERPLSLNQKVTYRGNYVDLTAEVADTEELRWWILGLGAGVEVLGPARLRRDIAARVAAMATLYAPK